MPSARSYARNKSSRRNNRPIHARSCDSNWRRQWQQGSGNSLPAQAESKETLRLAAPFAPRRQASAHPKATFVLHRIVHWLKSLAASLYWLSTMGKWGVNRVFDGLYRGQPRSETFRNIYREAFGPEFAEEADPSGFLTMTDLANVSRDLNLGPGKTFVDLACGRGGASLWVREPPARTWSASISRKLPSTKPRAAAATSVWMAARDLRRRRRRHGLCRRDVRRGREHRFAVPRARQGRRVSRGGAHPEARARVSPSPPGNSTSQIV